MSCRLSNNHLFRHSTDTGLLGLVLNGRCTGRYMLRRAVRDCIYAAPSLKTMASCFSKNAAENGRGSYWGMLVAYTASECGDERTGDIWKHLVLTS
jgi:hypothetical protein